MTSGARERPNVPEVDPREAWTEVEQGDAIIVDVREPEEIAEAAVPGAIHIPLGELGQHWSSLPHDKQVLFLCRSGNRSSYATAAAIQQGFPRSRNIRGGIIAWAEAGLPVR